MIIRKRDIRIEEREHLMGGKNSVFASWLLEIPQFNGAGRVFHRIVVPPLCEVGCHKHTGDSEVYYVLEGSGIYNDNGEEVRMSKGDMSFTPDGCSHGFYNDTEENLVLLACVLFNFSGKADITGMRKVRRAGTLARAEMHAPFGGKGDFYGEKLLEDEEFTGAGRLFNIMHLEKGCGLGLHPHKGETEAYYILSGKGVFNDDGEVREVLPGDITITGGGESHAIENTGEEELVFAALVFFDKN